MITTTVMYDGQQIQFKLADYPSLESIYKLLYDHLPKTFDARRQVIQLFDPVIGEFFDLNDDGLKSWLCLPMKEKHSMRLQVIRAEIDGHELNDGNMPDVFQKIERDIGTLFGAIENLQTTANGIRQDFQSALQKYQEEQSLLKKPTSSMVQPNAQAFSANRIRAQNNDTHLPVVPQGTKPSSSPTKNGHVERQIRYPAEDIRFKNVAPPTTVIPVKPQQQAPLVSNAYEDDDDDDDEQSEAEVEDVTPPPVPSIDIESTLLSVGEDFQALVSIAVNPSYFFIQNTMHTRDLEKLAQSMNDYYSTTDPPHVPFKPMEMTCCAARYSVDDRWYRARIKRYSSETTAELVYVDYGNNEERAIVELRPLDPAFARLPVQAICAALELLPINGENNSSWTKKASYKFHEDTLTKPLDVRVVAQPTLQWPMYFVQLTIDEHTDVAETLISLRHGRRASMNDIVRTVGPRLDLNDYAPYNLPTEILQHNINPPVPRAPLISIQPATKSRKPFRSIELPPVHLNLNGNIGSCTITSITSPSHFFIQLTEKNQFEQLYNHVHETYLERISCDRISRLKHPAGQAFGVARHPRDQRFYRVQIVNHDRERKTLLVLCFDIGEYINIQDSAIYELLPEYQVHAPQAIQCSLALVRSSMNEWSREALNFMNRFIGGKGYKTFRFYLLDAPSAAIKLGDPALPIILYEMDAAGQSINEQLVEKKHAVPEPTYLECIRLANDALSDLNGYKNQRIRQYIESQRTFTEHVNENAAAVVSAAFAERNPIDVRFEQPAIRPTMAEPLPQPENEEDMPYCPPVIDPELRHWYAVEVTHVKTPGEFYIRYPFGIDTSLGQGTQPAPYQEDIEPNRMLNDLHRKMAEVYGTEQRRGITTAAPYARGEMVAVRYQSQWYRARVLEFKPSTNFAWVLFVDQGDTRELGTNTMRPLHLKFLDVPLQAYLCCLDGFNADHPWTSQDKDLFKKKIRDKIFYAKKIREPNVIQLVEFVDREIVSFDAFWRTLHNPNRPVEPIPRHVPTANPRYAQQHTSSPAPFAPMAMNQAPMRHMHPSLAGIAPYGSGSDQSQGSSMMPKPGGVKRSSGATIPPFVSANKPPLQFVSAGFKAPVEYAHLTPNEQLAQLQKQEGHRIQPSSNGAYSINKHFRQPQ